SDSDRFSDVHNAQLRLHITLFHFVRELLRRLRLSHQFTKTKTHAGASGQLTDLRFIILLRSTYGPRRRAPASLRGRSAHGRAYRAVEALRIKPRWRGAAFRRARRIDRLPATQRKSRGHDLGTSARALWQTKISGSERSFENAGQKIARRGAFSEQSCCAQGSRRENDRRHGAHGSRAREDERRR